MNSKYIAWFSCGITSAVACKIAVEEYGAENVDLVYIKIDSAHQDNARFIADCEKWIGKKITIIRSGKYKDQFDVISKRRYINGPAGALCTTELKKEVRKKYEDENEFKGQVFGFEFSRKEVNRAIRFSEQYPSTNPKFPLISRKITKANCASIIEKVGIELPEMYKLGFSNNNCIGCVKGGKGYWNRIRINFPDHFQMMVDAEEEVGRSCINGKFLKDLDPMEGNGDKVIMPNCGNFCDLEFTETEDHRVSDIINGSVLFDQLELF